MKLTLNELKILRNALNSKMRCTCVGSSEFDDIHKSFNKVVNEIKRIENDIKHKTFDDIINNIHAIDSFEFSYGEIEPFINIEVDYVMLKDGELETLLSFKDKNKNCVITFK